jgi:hypothetical protein
MYESKLNNVKSEINEENLVNYDRVQSEKEMWEQKFE